MKFLQTPTPSANEGDYITKRQRAAKFTNEKEKLKIRSRIISVN